MPDTNYQQSNDTGGTPLDPPPPYRETAPDYSPYPADSHQFNGETFNTQGRSDSREPPPAFNPNGTQSDFIFTTNNQYSFQNVRVVSTNAQTTSITTHYGNNSRQRKSFILGLVIGFSVVIFVSAVTIIVVAIAP